ncbi:adenine nucleotide alpha hydrolases-like superfamily protein [Tanacetum coccineum]
MMKMVKPVMIVGVDESEESFFALEWTLDRFLVPSAPNPPFTLIIVHSKPTATSSLNFPIPGMDILSHVDEDLKNIAARVMEKANELCVSKLSTMLPMLDVGSHGYGAIKRAVLGSVSDYVTHHAHCTVMVVKKPKAIHDENHH